MIVRWRGDQALCDAEGIAMLYDVSARSVRRYCSPADYDPATRKALYDALGCENLLSQVIPRPARSAQARAQRTLMLAMRRK